MSIQAVHRTLWQTARPYVDFALQSIYFVLVMGGLVGGAFYGAHRGLVALDWSDSMGLSAALWVAVGIPCALYWPLRYRRGMKGHWRAATGQLLFLCFTGPLALLLGIPL